MAAELNGAYKITNRTGPLLSLTGPDNPVVVWPEKGATLWMVTQEPEGTAFISVVGSQSSLGYYGSAVDLQALTVGPAVEWELRESTEESHFYLVVPGGPIDGNELVVDLSPLQKFPPQAVLRPIRPDDLSQTWYFEPSE